jgi:chromosome segregation ATPase
VNASDVRQQSAERDREQLERELTRLRARLAALESELFEVQARANAAVGEAQEKAYWLDRLHIDLNRLMERPGASEVRVVLKAVRSAFWRLKRIKRRLFGPR